MIIGPYRCKFLGFFTFDKINFVNIGPLTTEITRLFTHPKIDSLEDIILDLRRWCPLKFELTAGVKLYPIT